MEEGARDYPNRTGLTENSIGDAGPSSTPSFFSMLSLTRVCSRRSPMSLECRNDSCKGPIRHI